MRKPLRYLHLVVGTLLGGYIYSPTLGASAPYQALIQFGVFPVVALSGLLIWQQPRLAKWRRQR